jgi:broad specificity phosphatase PhoE
MSTIYVIRHGEKPDGANQGVDITGAADQESLIPRGWQRAGALASFFGPRGMLPAPDRIYAAAAGKSKRSIETVTPLARKLKKDPIETYTKGDEASLVAEIAGLEGTTLVCWRHEGIPEIAKLIAGGTDGIPDPWPKDRFDVVWRFTREGKGKPWAFDQVCQGLLSGDGTQPIM